MEILTMNFFELHETQYKNVVINNEAVDIYIKPLSMRQTLSIRDIEKQEDQYWMYCVYGLVDNDGKQLFSTVDELYDNIPIKEANKLLGIVIDINKPDDELEETIKETAIDNVVEKTVEEVQKNKSKEKNVS